MNKSVIASTAKQSREDMDCFAKVRSDGASKDTLVLSRRQAIKLFGLAAGALVIGSRISPAASTNVSRLNHFISIHTDNTVKIICHRVDMGQGLRTTFGMIIADELDVDWKDVRVISGDGDPKYGNQDTDGSVSIRQHYEAARKMGATARAMLVSAAALEWKILETDCKTGSSYVINNKTGDKKSYGSIAAKASLLKPPSSPTLKPESEFKYIGKGCKSVDAHDIVTGKALYAIDVDIPGMLYASIERSPAKEGKVRKIKDAAALKVSGVKAVISLESQPQSVNREAGVAVIATNTWAALKGREALVVEWDLSKSPKISDAKRIRDLRAGFSLKPQIVRNEGDIKLATASGYTAEFYAPLLAHASMEPPCAVAHVTSKGCEIWAAVQNPQRLRTAAAEYLNIDEKHVTVHVTLLGGGFGRKSQPDFGIEAVALSQKIGKPVKVLFTREDDIKHDFYHADSYQEIKVGISADGVPLTWHHKTAFPTFMTVFNADAKELLPEELNMGAANNPYDIPNIKVEGFCVPSPVKIGWFRAVDNVFHAFAVNSVIDELAHRAQTDPVDYRLNLLKRNSSNERLKDVIRKVAHQAEWNMPLANGLFRGFASHDSFSSYVAAAVVVAVDGTEIQVKRVDIGIDCGFIVNPDVVKAQMEGAVVFGISLALRQQITLKKGVVEQSNFHDYPVVRMPECPQIHVYLAKKSDPPTGVGEPGLPPIAPAIAAAVFRATGQRLRTLPLRLA